MGRNPWYIFWDRSKTMIQTKVIMTCYFLFFLMLLFQGCEKSTMPLITPPEMMTDSTKIQVVWQEPIGVTDTNSYLSRGSLIVNEKVVIGADQQGRSVLFFRDKHTGDFAFKWEDWKKNTFFSQRGLALDNSVFVNSWFQTYLVNAENGETEWGSEIINHGDPRSNTTLGRIFHTARDDSPQTNNYGYLTELNKFTGESCGRNIRSRVSN